MVPIRLAGTGLYVPQKVLTNYDLQKTLDTTHEWVVKRTGVSERRIAAPNEAASDLALPAARQAMEAAGVSDRDLDYIILATITPDTHCPSAANWLQAKLDAPQAISFDVTAACSGFVFALDVATRYIQCGMAKTVLVAASEVMSRVQDWTDRSNCILWGDGAGAAVLTAGEGAPQIIDTYLGTDGANGQNLLMPGGGSKTTPITHESVDAKEHTLKMIEASASVRVAVKYFADSALLILERHGYKLEDVAHFIPHQANLRMLQAVAKRLGVDFDKFVITVDRYGNISSASSIIALAEAVHSGRIQPGDLVCITVFGGGLTWGSALIQF
ncbi:MAG: ketoacyl-ACP synthase III [Desulfarculaceae bacterium]|nr:ketoacyl-ACP synthase III [Desulfarculaceae bacterium]MCF8046579.1 ketoacyl-ACP synthase III [Desulfarculaceae bacterium]MCF8065108.1 ketoacyl-ACP synthase III [Desulfarculaceae bacterium]MCF8097074.1 ketoacyl-ACP synthase III [Desulfarculaceae bacterium]